MSRKFEAASSVDDDEEEHKQVKSKSKSKSKPSPSKKSPSKKSDMEIIDAVLDDPKLRKKFEEFQNEQRKDEQLNEIYEFILDNNEYFPREFLSTSTRSFRCSQCGKYGHKAASGVCSLSDSEHSQSECVAELKRRIQEMVNEGIFVNENA